MSDLTDLAPIDMQLLVFGYVLTCCIPARESLTRLNEAAITERTSTLDLSERYWDRTAADLRGATLNGGPVPASWALAGVRLADHFGRIVEP